MLLVQSFTARMPLLTAASAFGLERRRWSSPQQCYLLCLRNKTKIKLNQKTQASLIAASKLAAYYIHSTPFREVKVGKYGEKKAEKEKGKREE